MNDLFEQEIRGHHSMRDHLLTVVSDRDLAYRLPGENPTLGELLVQMGEIQGVYAHSFETLNLDWTYRQLAPPAAMTIDSLQAWFGAQDDAMSKALSRFTEDELHVDQIDRGHAVHRVAVRPGPDLSGGDLHLLRQAQRVPQSART